MTDVLIWRRIFIIKLKSGIMLGCISKKSNMEHLQSCALNT